MPQLKTFGLNNTDSTLNKMPKPQKTAVIVLTILAVLIVVFWIWQFRSQVNRPFNYNSDKSTTSGTTADYTTALKEQDTDKDELSDYDEIYVYKTSPYLEDTDSDGLTDKQEVNLGKDPNCPEGKNCQASEEVASSTVTTTDGDGTSTSDQAAITLPADLSSAGISTTTLQNALNGQIDAATLRQLLIAGGATKEDLDQISDADLLKSYQETLNSQTQNQTTQ
jgi:hypothetical protein